MLLIILKADTLFKLLTKSHFKTNGLYQWLDGPDRFFESAINKCGSADVIVLAIETEGKLAHLPWEIMHDGKSFFAQQQNPFVVPVRWQDKRSSEYEPENRPLQVLFMATSPIGVEPKLDFEKEEGLILDSTSRHPLILTVEESGDLEELKHLINSYPPGWFDVFHLSGHANHTDDGGRFLTETETGNEYQASAEDIVDALARMPKIVFLSGCRTGEAMKEGAVPSLSEKLLELGAKTVLGWGRPVSDKGA